MKSIMRLSDNLVLKVTINDIGAIMDQIQKCMKKGRLFYFPCPNGGFKLINPNHIILIEHIPE